MKLGYSILLGEHIDAALLDRSDVKDFQVVCPNCREPLFKLVRDDKGVDRHFLSHYERASALDADCDLRVSGYKATEIEKTNAISRGQKIEYFLSVIQDAARNATGIFKDEATGKDAIQRVLNSPRFMAFWKDYRRALVQSKDIMMKDFGAFADEWQEGQYEVKTTFAREVQVRISSDVLRHLLSPNAAPSFYYVIACGTLFTIALTEGRFERNDVLPDAVHMHKLLVALIRPERMSPPVWEFEAKRIYRYPMVVEPMPAWSKMAAEIYSNTIGILTRIPYFELLKAAAPKTPPH